MFNTDSEGSGQGHVETFGNSFADWKTSVCVCFQRRFGSTVAISAVVSGG